jgi:hypothetical protein
MILPDLTMRNTKGVLLETRTAYSARAPGFRSCFFGWWVRVATFWVCNKSNTTGATSGTGTA